MRFYNYLIILLAFAGCNTKTNKPTQNSAAQISEPIPFAGCWVNQEYYDSLMLYKSPGNAQSGSSYMEIPDSTLKPFMMIYNFHEGMNGFLIIKNGERYELCLKTEDSLINHGPIKMLGPDKINFAEETFRKVNMVPGASNPRLLEALLFKGIYTNDKAETIEFKSDGTLTGLTGYAGYEPMLDYFDAGRQVDQVTLHLSDTKKSALMAFKFKGDTLELYRLKCITEEQGECVEVSYGEIEHRLWRK